MSTRLLSTFIQMAAWMFQLLHINIFLFACRSSHRLYAFCIINFGIYTESRKLGGKLSENLSESSWSLLQKKSAGLFYFSALEISLWKKVNKSQWATVDVKQIPVFFTACNSLEKATKCSSDGGSSMWVDDDEHINAMCFIFFGASEYTYCSYVAGEFLNAHDNKKNIALHLIFAWTNFFIYAHLNPNQNKQRRVQRVGMMPHCQNMTVVKVARKINHINSGCERGFF